MPSTILSAIRAVAEARGFKNFAESGDLNRENLYRVLSEGGNPRLDTFLKSSTHWDFDCQSKRSERFLNCTRSSTRFSLQCDGR